MRQITLPLLATVSLAIGAVYFCSGGISAASLTGSTSSGSLASPPAGPALRVLAGSATTDRGAANATRIGTRIRAIGTGFGPGTRVSIGYALAETGFARKPIARAAVGPTGMFDASFTLTRAIAEGGRAASSERYPGSVQPLLFEAYEGASTGTGRHRAHAVAALVISSPVSVPARPRLGYAPS